MNEAVEGTPLPTAVLTVTGLGTLLKEEHDSESGNSAVAGQPQREGHG